MRKILLFCVAFIMLGTMYSQVSTIGTGNRTYTNLPINPYYQYSYSQSIYLASEINQSGDIYRIKYKGTPGLSISKSNEWTVYIGHTTQEVFTTTSWVEVANMTEVFSGVVEVVDDNVVITLSTPFTYNGTDNLVVAVDENTTGYDGSVNRFYASGVEGLRSIYHRHDQNNPDPTSPPEGSTIDAIANIDIDFNVTPCETPKTLAAANITKTSADLSWTAGGSETEWDLQYGVKGFALGSGTEVSSSVNTYSLTGLTAGTYYDFYVRAKCTTNSMSGWVGPYTFLTQCDPFQVPYFEGFEAGYTQGENIGGCTTQESVAGAFAWRANTSLTTYNRAPRTGSWNAYLGYNNNDWIFIPVDLTAGKTYEVELYARQDATSGATMKISYGNTGSAADMTNEIVAETVIGDGEYQKISGSFSPTTSGTYYVGINGTLNFTPYYLSIDDIKIAELVTEACVAPTNLSAINITKSTAELTWTAGGSETAWVVEYGEAGFTQGSGTTINTTTNPHMLTGLTENTNYDFYVKADCGSANNQSDWAGPHSFTVTCSSFTPTYVESFENGNVHAEDLAGCFTQVDVAGANSAWKANNTHTSYNRTPRTGEWNIYLRYSNEDWFFVPVTLTAGQSYTVDLFARQDGNTGASIAISYGNSNTVEAMTNVIVAEKEVVSGNYQEIRGDFTPDATGLYYIGVKGKVTFSPFYLSVDDFRIMKTPSCVSPTSLSATNITDTTADLSWTAGGSETAWIVEYGEAGFTHGSGTVVNTTTATHSLTGLTPNTNYEFYVKSDCGNNDLSTWSGPFSFTTKCPPFSIPYSEGFETGYTHDAAIAGCISQENISGGRNWVANNTHVNFNRGPRTGDWNATLRYNNTSWMYILVNLEAGTTYEFKSYARQDGKTGAQISVSYGTSAESGSMTNSIVAETELVDGDYQEIKGNFTPTESGAYFVGIKGQLNTTPYYLSLDDISITVAPTCSAPKELAVSNVTDTSADLSWTAGGSETAWIIEYGEAGFTQGSGTTVNATTNSHSLTGLTANTSYEFYVKADCGTTDGQSEWSQSFTFSTVCTPLTIAYTENFDGVTAPALPDCWAKIKENNASTFADIVTTSEVNSSAPNSIHIKNGSYLTGHFYLVSPKFSDLNNEKKIIFKVYKDIGTDADGDVVEVGVMTDVSDTNTYTNIHTYSLSDFDEDAWKEVRADFTNYTGGAGHIVIRVKPGTGTFNNWYFDDFFYDTALSVTEVASDKMLTYYPNPVEDYLYINAESVVKNVKIFNSNGQLVLDKNTNSASIEVNTSKLSSGIYVVRATLGDKDKVFKILKK